MAEQLHAFVSDGRLSPAECTQIGTLHTPQPVVNRALLELAASTRTGAAPCPTILAAPPCPSSAPSAPRGVGQLQTTTARHESSPRRISADSTSPGSIVPAS